MTTDQINGIETNGLTVGQLAEQLSKKAGCEEAAEGFKMNIDPASKQPDAQSILDEVGKSHPLFYNETEDETLEWIQNSSRNNKQEMV